MKLGEIKIEALKLMFANGREYISADGIEQLKDMEEYCDYLISMPGAINRCFALLEEMRVLPSKSFTLGEGGRYALDELIPDFFDLERIVYEGREYNPNCEYYREGDEIIISDYEPAGEYRVIYKPMLTRIFDSTDEDTELPIPDRIACYIPYFIKSELFRADEPDEADIARRWFTSALEQISKSEDGRQTGVLRRYSVYEV